MQRNVTGMKAVSYRFLLIYHEHFINNQTYPLLACIFWVRLTSTKKEKRYKLLLNTARREQMLRDKIDYAKFLTWFIENYPDSAKQTKENQDSKDFWNQFK